MDFAGVEPNTARDHRVKLPKAEFEEVNPPTAKQFLSILDRIPQARRLAFVTMEQCALEPGGYLIPHLRRRRRCREQVQAPAKERQGQPLSPCSLAAGS